MVHESEPVVVLMAFVFSALVGVFFGYYRRASGIPGPDRRAEIRIKGGLNCNNG